MKKFSEYQSCKKIIDQIKDKFDGVQKRKDIQNKGGWTKAFLNALLEIGSKQEGIKVYSSSVDKLNKKVPAGGEWLFDLCWSYEPEGNEDWKKNYKGLKLICESEWETSDDEILYDFLKLAVAKAEIKIMIVQFSGTNEYYKIKDACERSVDKALHNDGSMYFLVGSGNKDDDELKFEQLWVND